MNTPIGVVNCVNRSGETLEGGKLLPAELIWRAQTDFILRLFIKESVGFFHHKTLGITLNVPKSF